MHCDLKILAISLHMVSEWISEWALVSICREYRPISYSQCSTDRTIVDLLIDLTQINVTSSQRQNDAKAPEKILFVHLNKHCRKNQQVRTLTRFIFAVLCFLQLVPVLLCTFWCNASQCDILVLQCQEQIGAVTLVDSLVYGDDTECHWNRTNQFRMEKNKQARTCNLDVSSLWSLGRVSGLDKLGRFVTGC